MVARRHVQPGYLRQAGQHRLLQLLGHPGALPELGLHAGERAAQLFLELVAAGPLALRLEPHQPQAQLGGADVGEVAQGVQLLVGPGSRAPVDRAEGAEDTAVVVGQRHPGVGPHTEIGDGEVVAHQRMRGGVGDDQGLGRGDDVLAERVAEGGGPDRRPRLGQPGGPGEDLRVVPHERHEGHGDPQPTADALGDRLHPRVGDGAEAGLRERA